MRIALISDSHSQANLDFILAYIRQKNLSWKLDLIIINGDMLGENEVREGYGYNFNKTVFHAALNKETILKNIFPEKFDDLIKIAKNIEQGNIDTNQELEYSQTIKEYLQKRYEQLFKTLEKSSQIAKTYFNIGGYESPVHYNAIKELAFLLETSEPNLRKIAVLSNYRDTFNEFLGKVKQIKKLKYIGGLSTLEGDLLIAAIPGLNPSSVVSDSLSEFQENITKDLMYSAARQLSYASKLLLLNPTSGRLKKPFAFRPQSQSVREFIEKTKDKLRQKVFVQSYYHMFTTHFYTAAGYNFILNNAAVNNCLFNIIEFTNKINCYDIDPKKDKSRKLSLYDTSKQYSSPEERLKLNYEDAQEVIKERNIEGCYYM